MIIPCKSYFGELPPLSEYENATVQRLRADVTMLAETIGARNTKNLRQLHLAADFIEDSFNEMGFSDRRDGYEVGGMSVVNIEAELVGTRLQGEIVVIGAHYDSAYSAELLGRTIMPPVLPECWNWPNSSSTHLQSVPCAL